MRRELTTTVEPTLTAYGRGRSGGKDKGGREPKTRPTRKGGQKIPPQS